MNTTADTPENRWSVLMDNVRRGTVWLREHLVAEDPHPEPSALDLRDGRQRECAVDAPDLAEPTGLDIDRQHIRLTGSRAAWLSTPYPALARTIFGTDPLNDEPIALPPIHTHLHDLGELTDEQYQALAGIADGSTSWTPPAPPSHETRPLPRRTPIDVTDRLTPGGKALARQRTEQMLALAGAVDAAPAVSPERRAAAEAYRTALRTRIEEERTARRQGKSARGTGSETQALAAAWMYLDRTEAEGLPRETWAHLAAIVLAEYTGEVAA